ncbi:MAG: ABC transporter substrate-binding protein [Desulfoferrobacter sp.]
MNIAVITPSFNGYTVYVALEKGYFKQQGLDVTVESFSHGRATMEAVREGKVDLAASSETPIHAHGFEWGKDLRICHHVHR